MKKLVEDTNSKKGAFIQLDNLTTRFGWFLALMLGFLTVAAQAQEFRYHYVPLDQASLPMGFQNFRPKDIDERGKVYGNADDASGIRHVAVYQNGAVTVVQPDLPSFIYNGVGMVNARGTSGSGVGILYGDYTVASSQAALFRGSQLELIPRLPGEDISWVIALNDSGMALVGSYTPEPRAETFAIYKNGQLTPINLGPDVPYRFFVSMNNNGIISGTTFTAGFDYIGFRFDTRTGQTNLLYPIAGDSQAWALGINSRGNILGYSWEFGEIERVGVWDRNGVFTPYFVQGTTEFPTLSNNLLFNDNNLIVITDLFEDVRTSYVVPRPGVRLNLADLVENLPSGVMPSIITNINNRGDMIGYTDDGIHFKLERIDATMLAPSAEPAASSAAESELNSVPPVAAPAMAPQRDNAFKLGFPWNLSQRVPSKGSRLQP